jgi:hypothetical protein
MSVTTNPTVNSINSSTTETPMTKTPIAAAAPAASFVQPLTIGTSIKHLGDIRDSLKVVIADLTHSHAKLRQELAKTLAVYRAGYMKADAAEKAAYIEELIKEIDPDHATALKRSDPLGLFIRFVFKCDRKKAHKYLAALKLAQANNVADEDVADFIAGNGGVENIHLVKSPAKKKTTNPHAATLQQKAKTTVDSLFLTRNQKALTTLSFNDIKVKGDFVLLLGKPTNGGKDLHVVEMLESPDPNLIESFKQPFIKAETERLIKADAEAMAKQSAKDALYTDSDFSQPLQIAGEQALGSPSKVNQTQDTSAQTEAITA